MARFSITISDELDAWLKIEAKKEDRSKSGQVAHILSIFFEERLTKDDVATISMCINGFITDTIGAYTSDEDVNDLHLLIKKLERMI